uniref:Uncharacterized protein n=1 Tax=Anopheles gambiae TaxID=7165 RepID=A0A0E4G8Y4_ANOGA
MGRGCMPSRLQSNGRRQLRPNCSHSKKKGDELTHRRRARNHAARVFSSLPPVIEKKIHRCCPGARILIIIVIIIAASSSSRHLHHRCIIIIIVIIIVIITAQGAAQQQHHRRIIAIAVWPESSSKRCSAHQHRGPHILAASAGRVHHAGIPLVEYPRVGSSPSVLKGGDVVGSRADPWTCRGSCAATRQRPGGRQCTRTLSHTLSSARLSVCRAPYRQSVHEGRSSRSSRQGRSVRLVRGHCTYYFKV